MPFAFDLDGFYVWRIAVTVVMVMVVVALSRLLKRITGRIIEEPARQYRISKLIGRTMALMLVVTMVAIWAPGRGDVLTILTVIGAGTAIAMREALLSFAGWFNLVLRQPYRVGDRIEVNGIRGDVIDVRLLHTTMMEVGGWVDADQSTGRIVHVPNSWLFVHGMYNYSQGFTFVWHELTVTVTFRSDWQKARTIMQDLARESAAIVESQAAGQIRKLSREYLVHYSILTPFVYVTVAENGVKLTLRYLTEVRKRRGTQHAFTVSILEAFREQGIEFAPRTHFVVDGGESLFATNTPTETRHP